MITYEYEVPLKQHEKYELMEFVYNNTDSFIMNTFGFLWEERCWWEEFPVLVAREHNQVIGIHAYSLNMRTSDTVKTYYIVTHKDYKGRGVAREMTKILLEDCVNFSARYYVNSSADSQGVAFYSKMFGPSVICKNEFGGFDYEFEDSIENILKKL